MKKKVSLGFVFAMVLVLLTAAALATGLLLSPRADAVRTADRALEEKYGITAGMQSFFAREQQEMQDGTVKVTYSGAGSLEWVLGTYTAVVKDGKAEVTWNHDGEDTSGGYEAEAWGPEQLKQMMEESTDEKLKLAYLKKAEAISYEHTAPKQYKEPTDAEVEAGHRQMEENKTAAMNARKVSEEEMIATGREFIISNWGLDEEQVSRLELYTNFDREDAEAADNSWYDMINGKPCFEVEYLLYQPYTAEQMENNEPLQYKDKDGFYVVYVNVETGEIEEYEYNNGLAGLG